MKADIPKSNVFNMPNITGKVRFVSSPLLISTIPITRKVIDTRQIRMEGFLILICSLPGSIEFRVSGFEFRVFSEVSLFLVSFQSLMRENLPRRSQR